MLEDSKVLELMREHSAELIEQSIKYRNRWNTFVTWETLKKKEGADVKVHTNFFYRFCKTHASYVVKDVPNIQVPAENPDQLESKIRASSIERALYMRWSWNQFWRKLKTAALRWSVFGDMYFMLSYDTDNKWVGIDILDPSLVIYDTIDSDPLSPISFIMKANMRDVKVLREEYPDKKDIITPSNEVDNLLQINNFVKTTMWSDKKAVVYTYIDDTYVYKVLNLTHVLDKKEHKMWFIPFYHRPYIDIGDKYGASMVDVLYESVKMMHMSLSFMMTNAFDTAQSPLISIWGNPQWDKNNWPKWLISMPQGGAINYLQAPISNADLYKTLEYAKVFMHFISWISEEAMAWFTWALTSAWVSIELRLDSTVREAIDSQIVLKDILEQMNADWLKLMEKFLKNENILRAKDRWSYGNILKFTWAMIWKQYINTVDFWGILPRSESTIVNNVLAKHRMQLISTDTALEELRYQDPSMEVAKKMKEEVDRFKMQKAMQSWQEANLVGYEWPKDENYAMITENTPVPVLPEQDHIEHWMEHQKAYGSTQNPLIMVHMMSHKSMMQQQQQWVQWIPSAESQRERTKEAYQQPSSRYEWAQQTEQYNQSMSQQGWEFPQEWGV